MTARPDAGGSAQHRRRLIAVVFAALLVCSGATLAIGSGLFGWFSSSGGWFSVESPERKAAKTQVPLAYVAGRTLYRPNKRPQLLARPVRSAPRQTLDLPLAVSSPDGRYVVYPAVLSERYYPTTSFISALYVHDTLTQKEKVLARGAYSAAWSRDGRIAYVKADHERYNLSGAGNGQVVVQTLNGAPTEWTRRSNGFQVLAWAGDEVVVEIRYCILYSPGCREQPGPGVYALNRSGRLRPLNLEKFIALSPDGRFAFGIAERFMFDKEQLLPRVRISRVDTGKVVTTLNLERLVKKLLPDSASFEYSSGSWRGNSIAVTYGPSLAFLKQRNRQLAFESIITVPRQLLTRMEYPDRLDVLLSTGSASDRFAVAAHGSGRNVRYVEALLSCSRSTRSCVRAAYLPRDRSLGVFAVVENPSRP